MAVDLTTLKTTIGVVIGILTILGVIFGWFKNAFVWARGFFQHPRSTALIEIPGRTVVLQPDPRPNLFWWHMGRSGDKPAMQISGHFTVTNICKYKILITAAKMRKPKALGHALVKDLQSNYYGSYMIPEGGVTGLSFDFWIMPPAKKEGENLEADVAILDQFGNEHWVKNIEFTYR
jgi:hypothetical protein